MSDYVREIILTASFQGETVTAVFKPITFADLIKIGDVDLKAITPEQVRDLLGIAKPYMLRLSGLKTADAQDVTAEELFEQSYFVEAASTLAIKWLAKAAPADPPSPSA